mgnify:FL=1
MKLELLTDISFLALGYASTEFIPLTVNLLQVFRDHRLLGLI